MGPSDISKVLRDNARLKPDMVEMQQTVAGVAVAGGKAKKNMQGASGGQALRHIKSFALMLTGGGGVLRLRLIGFAVGGR